MPFSNHKVMPKFSPKHQTLHDSTSNKGPQTITEESGDDKYLSIVLAVLFCHIFHTQNMELVSNEAANISQFLLGRRVLALKYQTANEKQFKDCFVTFRLHLIQFE